MASYSSLPTKRDLSFALSPWDHSGFNSKSSSQANWCRQQKALRPCQCLPATSHPFGLLWGSRLPRVGARARVWSSHDHQTHSHSLMDAHAMVVDSWQGFIFSLPLHTSRAIHIISLYFSSYPWKVVLSSLRCVWRVFLLLSLQRKPSPWPLSLPPCWLSSRAGGQSFAAQWAGTQPQPLNGSVWPVSSLLLQCLVQSLSSYI